MTSPHVSERVIPFALGELPAAEAAALREHVEQCASCRAELDDVRSTLAVLALTATGPAAPARSRERLLNAIAGVSAGESAKVSRREQSEERMERSMPLAIMQRPWWSFAPAIAAAVLAVFAILLWTNDLSLRRELEAAQQRAAAAQQQAADLKSGSDADLERARLVIDGLTAPYSQRFTLTTAKSRPQPTANALYMPSHHALVLIAHDLPPVPQGKAYELWMLPKNGDKPMPVGVFWPDRTGSAMMTMPAMNEAPEAKGFAVTVESAAGSPKPTSPIILSGE